MINTTSQAVILLGKVIGERATLSSSEGYSLFRDRFMALNAIIKGKSFYCNFRDQLILLPNIYRHASCLLSNSEIRIVETSFQRQ